MKYLITGIIVIYLGFYIGFDATAPNLHLAKIRLSHLRRLYGTESGV